MENNNVSLNRAQRRMQEKMAKQTKRKRQHHIDSFAEAIKKATYIDLIEKVRKLNEEKENGTTEDREEDI